MRQGVSVCIADSRLTEYFRGGHTPHDGKIDESTGPWN